MKRKRKYANRNRFASLNSVVRYMRTRRGLTQADVSKMCGHRISPNDLSKLERGNFGLHIAKLVIIADFFDVSIQTIVKNDFLSARYEPQANSSERNKKASRKHKKIQAKMDAAGERGEELVVSMEKERLMGTGFEHLVTGDYALDESSGFDIFSFTEAGTPLYLEVKSSIGNEQQFFISTNELEFIQFCAEHKLPYQLIRIRNVFEKSKRTFTIYTAEEVLQMGMKAQVFLAKEA